MLKGRENAKNAINLGYNCLKLPRNTYTKEQHDVIKQFSLRHRSKADMTLNSTVSHNKIKDSVFHQMPNTATICRAPEGREVSLVCKYHLRCLFLHEIVPESSHLPYS